MNKEILEEISKKRKYYKNEIHRKLAALSHKYSLNSDKARWRISLNVLNIINDDLKMQGRRFILRGIPIEMECEEIDILELYVRVEE